MNKLNELIKRSKEVFLMEFKYEKIFFSITIFVLLVSNAFLFIRLDKNRSRYNDIRQQFTTITEREQSAQNRVRELEERIAAIKARTERADELISNSITTVRGLSEAITECKNYVKDLENIINSSGLSLDNNSDSSNSNEVKE